MTWFDESRLDEPALVASGSPADVRLRGLAESGGRVRREAAAGAEAVEEAVAQAADAGRPRAVVVAGPDSRLLRAVLEPVCPVPFVAWAHPGLPGWAGSLDLVVVLAPDGSDPVVAGTVAEANRRGCRLVVACPPRSLVAEHAPGHDATLLPVETTDPLAIAVTLLGLLGRLSLGPATTADAVATALDAVAVSCSPFRDISVNPAKTLAIALADGTPLVWGGTPLAARAARRVAEALRRASGRMALSGDATHLLPVLESARARDLFDDPFDGSQGAEPRPILLVLDDQAGTDDPLLVTTRRQLTDTADARGVRVEVLAVDPETTPLGDVAGYGSLLLQGLYAAEYLRLGLVED
jgi:hypothetical protein